MRNDECEVSIVMPCLNEAETLATCIKKAWSCIERLGVAAEIVVADNGSTDGSQRIAQAEGARVVAVAERGYGAALHRGVIESRGRFIIMGDADDSYDFSRLDRFLTRLREGADLVMGNRFLGGISPGAMPWKNRHIGTPALSLIGRLFFKCVARDFNCGMRGFSREAFDRLQMQTTGMEFASEMVIKATLMDMRVVEVPTTLDRDGRTRPPHLRPWRDGWRHLRFMLLYSPRWLFVYPGLFLMLGGGLLGTLLLPGPLVVAANVGLDVHTLLFSFAAVLLGFQCVSFGLFARVYALNEGLLPRDPTLERMVRSFSLESGLLTGMIILTLGACGAVYAVIGWSRVDFGALDARSTLRTAIPAATAICLGGQIILMSFLFSFLGLRRRHTAVDLRSESYGEGTVTEAPRSLSKPSM